MKKSLKRTLSVMLVLVMMIPIFAMPADALTVSVIDEGYRYERNNIPCVYYKDVDTTSWSYPYICYVSSCGFMRGTGNNCFSPNGTITKAEVDIVLKRIRGLNPIWRPDNRICTRKITAYAVWNDYYNHNPKARHLTPEEIDKQLGKYSDSSDLPSSYREAWAWCIKRGIINGMDGKLCLNNYLSREQFATLITRYHIILIVDSCRQ